MLKKSLVISMASLMLFSCGSNNQESSKQKEESSVPESLFVDPNVATFPSAYSLDQKVNSKLSVSLECEHGGAHENINLVRYNEYTKFSDSSHNVFVKNESGDGLFYTKDENGLYTSFSIDTYSSDVYYKQAYVACLAGQSLTFSSHREITFLGRECVEYSNDPDWNKSLIQDKETSLILRFDIDLDNPGYNFKFEAKEICLGDNVSRLIRQDIDNIKAAPLSSEMLKGLGFEGELETPKFAINGCSSTWQNNDLVEYRIEYKDRVNSGNDTYINQFETLTRGLYDLGFSKDSQAAITAKEYEELVVDSTIEYNADITFLAFGTKNGKTYKIESNLTVIGGYATITFVINHIA